METISELKVICQTTAKKDVSNVYMRYVCRNLSIYLTRLLIPTPITPNQVSFAMILTGLLAAVLFLCPSLGMYLAGSLVLQFWYILDCVDGELARYRRYVKEKTVTTEKIQLPLTGGYWDFLNHYIVHGFVFLGLSFGLFSRDASSAWLILGYLASMGQVMLLAIHDTKSRAFIGKVQALGLRHSLRTRVPSSDAIKTSPKPFPSIPKIFFVAMHYSCTFPSVMNVITLGAIFSMVLGKDLRCWVITYYALSSLVVFIGLAAKNLVNQGIDREFEKVFEWTTRNDNPGQ